MVNSKDPSPQGDPQLQHDAPEFPNGAVKSPQPSDGRPSGGRPSDGRPSDWTTFFFRDTRALMLLIGMIAVSGLTSLAILPRMEDPVLTRRVALVVTRLPGSDAGRVESLVTEPIEEKLQEVEEVKLLKSESRPGISTITIELLDEVTEPDEVWSDIRGKINDAAALLPVDALKPAFEELDVRAYALIVSVVQDTPASANGNGDSTDHVHWSTLRRYAKLLQDDLQAIPGTEIVDRFADPGEEITVVLNPRDAAALGLSATAVARQLAGADAKQSAGMIRGTESQRVVEIDNQFRESDAIADTLVRSSKSGSAVRVGDIAKIHRGVTDPMPRFAAIDGKPGVTLGAMVRNNSRVDHWRLLAEPTLAEFESRLPDGLSLDITLDQSGYVTNRLSSLVGNLVLGVIAVVCVIWFLMGFRSAIVVALALPLSGFSVLFGLRILGIPIHQMSITGMIIAIGLLIDNAIVAVDEVTAEIKSGHDPMSALSNTVRHLAVPLAGSTVTTALAFAPIAMMPGPAGEFVGAISISVILAVFSSLFFSLTVIPVIAAKFLGGTTSAGSIWQRGFSSRRLASGYRNVVGWMIARPYRGVLVSLMLPMLGFFLFAKLPEQFFPAADRDQFYVEVELSSDASIEKTRRVSLQVDQLLQDAGAKKVSWFYGESAPAFYYNIVGSRRGSPHFAAAVVQMSSADGILEKLRDLQRDVDVAVPEARVLMRQLEQGPPFTAPIEVRLFGPDLQRLTELGDQVRVILSEIPSVTHTKSLLGESLATVSLKVDEANATMAGLRPSDVSDQLFDHLEGAIAGRIIEDTEQIPVRVRIGEQARGELSLVKSIELTNPSGQRIPLASVATTTLQPEIAVISRRDRQRMNEVAGYVAAGTLPSLALNEFNRRLAESDFELPPGYRLDYGGEASQRNQAVGNLMANVGLLVIAMIATLVLSFRSFRMAGLVLMVAALSTGLGMIGLYVGGYPFGFMAIIGTMGLIGVAINDSIVVLAALRAHEATLPAGSTIDRSDVVTVVTKCTRHVVATTLTTIAGFSPLIIAGGKFWPPLAVAIAGGVSGATLLALCLVPSVFTMMRCKRNPIRSVSLQSKPTPEISRAEPQIA